MPFKNNETGETHMSAEPAHTPTEEAAQGVWAAGPPLQGPRLPASYARRGLAGPTTNPLRFAERLLCLRFLITTSCFLHFCRAVLALFRGSRHFGYRAGYIHQEPNRASFQIRQIHPLWSAVVCDCHGDFRV